MKASDFAHTAKSLDKFRFGVLKGARKNLALKQSRTSASGGRFSSAINSTGILSKSLKSSRHILDVEFSMKGYGLYVDIGRKKGKFPPVDAIKEWIKEKPIILRDSEGKFAKKTPSAMNSLAFLIGRSIKEHGIKKTDFFTKPLEEGMEELDEVAYQVIFKDIDNYLPDTI